MEHVRFGRTGIKVSRACLGTMTFGDQSDRDVSFAIMDAAADAGVTFLRHRRCVPEPRTA